MYTVETVEGIHHICENGYPIGEIWDCEDANDFATFLNSRPMTVSEAGAKGGKKTAEKHGSKHYQEIARKGGQKAREILGREHYVNAGRKGAAARWKAEKAVKHEEI
jgi:general stress protein YciG